MDSSQTRLLAVLSVLVAVVAGILYFQGRAGEEEVDPEATHEVWKLEADAIVGVRVERAAGVLALDRKDGTWTVREPFVGRADDDQVRELLDALAEIGRGIPVEGAADHPADFGLGDPPSARVTVTVAEGTVAEGAPAGVTPAEGERKLDVGAAAPIGYRTYVRAPDGVIAAVNGDANRPLQADAARYRDRRIFRFDAAQVRKVTVSGPDGVLEVSGQGKDWWLAGFGHADADKVDDLVVGLLDLRFDTVLDAPPPIAAPVYDVRVTFADGSVAGLSSGDASPIDGGTFVTTVDGRGGTVWPEALKQLTRGPTDTGWRTAFGIRMDVADEVTFATDDWKVEARRNGAAWSAPSRDDGDVYDGISALSRVELVYQRDPPPPPAEVVYRVTVKEGDRSWTIEVGPPGSDGFRAVRDPAGGAPMRVTAGSLDPVIDALSPR